MTIEEMSTEDLIEQLGISLEEFAIDEFDRWCISNNIAQGEHPIHKDWLYKIYLVVHRRNPRRYKPGAFTKRLAKNLKVEGDYFYCNRSLDDLKRHLNDLEYTYGPKLDVSDVRALNRFKRFIEVANIVDGDTSVRIDMLYKVYLDYIETVGLQKRSSYSVFARLMPTLLKTRDTINNVWVKINPDYKKEFVNGETEEPKSEVEVSSPRSIVES